MLGNINEIAVIVSAILAMAVGSIWYSPLLFGDYWMRAAGVSKEQIENSKIKLPTLLIFGFFANAILLFVVANFVLLSQKIGYPLAGTGTLLVLLLGSVLASAVIWEQKSLVYLIINIGYAAVVIYGGMSIIWLWPW